MNFAFNVRKKYRIDSHNLNKINLTSYFEQTPQSTKVKFPTPLLKIQRKTHNAKKKRKYTAAIEI